MSETADQMAEPDRLMLHLQGFEGPLDLLLDLARLAWLKSRLLVPADEEGAEEGEAAAEQLAARLRDLARVRQLAEWLGQQPQIGQDVFARGAPEDFTEADSSGLSAGLPSLLRAYIAVLRRGMGEATYRPTPHRLWSVQEAITRLTRLLGRLPPGWNALESFLPKGFATPLERRGAYASALIASLEMARNGQILLEQPEAFAPIMLAAAPDAAV